MRADPAAIGPEATPEGASVDSDRTALRFGKQTRTGTSGVRVSRFLANQRQSGKLTTPLALPVARDYNRLLSRGRSQIINGSFCQGVRQNVEEC